MRRRASISGPIGPANSLPLFVPTSSSSNSSSSVPLPSSSSQDASSGSQKMVVAVRVRPLSKSELEAGHTSCVSLLSNNTVVIKKGASDAASAGYLKSQMTTLNEYAFDNAFGQDVTQREIYEKTAKPFVPNVIEGLNVTVFAYGATGAGKTHTMLGNTRQDDAAANAEAGIIPNAVLDLFQQLEQKKANLAFGEDYSVILSFIEVYNEQVYDLLETSGKVLSLREDQDKGVVVVAGVTESVVTSYNDVMQLLAEGNRNRKTESTMANAVSSRSHAVLQLLVRHTRRTESGRECVTDSKLSLIDLAGSERASATCNRGARLQEGANINKSLLALANCINSLATNSNSGAGKKAVNVKYRDSKLTHLLKSSLEGNCNLVMICNINPSHVTYEDSHNTLKYANRAKNIKVNPVMKESTKESNWMEREEKLREENAALRKRVAELERELAAYRNGEAIPNGMFNAGEDVVGVMSESIDATSEWDESAEGEKMNDSMGGDNAMFFEPENSPPRNTSQRVETEGVQEIGNSSSNERKRSPKRSFCEISDPCPEEEVVNVLTTKDVERESYNALSDSILEAGLFSLDDSVLLSAGTTTVPSTNVNVNVNDNMIVQDFTMDTDEAETISSKVKANPNKKRRGSFIPMPRSRKSILALSPQSSNAANATVSTSSTVSATSNTSTATVKPVPVTVTNANTTASTTATATTTLTTSASEAGIATRTRRRMSLGQENANPNTLPATKDTLGTKDVVVKVNAKQTVVNNNNNNTTTTNKDKEKEKEDQLPFKDVATSKPTSNGNARRNSLANVASLLDQIPLQEQVPKKGLGLGGVTRSSRRLSLNSMNVAAIAPEKSEAPNVYIDI